MSYSPVQIFPPDSDTAQLSVEQFPLDKFLGTWHVVWSTLPLWKDKKDVRITYTALDADSSGRSRMDDLVEYRKRSAGKDTAPSTVRGIDTLDNSVNGATFNWRGKGWLMIASSHWQFLGYDHANAEPEWAVTYFSKTLFTPAGLDVYLRKPLTELGEEGQTLLRAIVEGIVASPEEAISKLAREGGSIVGGA